MATYDKVPKKPVVETPAQKAARLSKSAKVLSGLEKKAAVKPFTATANSIATSWKSTKVVPASSVVKTPLSKLSLNSTITGPARVTGTAKPVIAGLDSTTLSPRPKKAPAAGIDYKAIVRKEREEKLNAILKKVDSAAPYLSNVANSMQRLPNPKAPHLDAPIVLSKLNMDNDRYMVERGIRGSNANAYARMDENTAEAVTQSNLATRFNQLSSVNQAERNGNVLITNESIKTNAAIAAGNNNKLDAFDDKGIERKIAQMNNSSANIANAGDKYVGMQNYKKQLDLEAYKTKILLGTDTNLALTRKMNQWAEDDAAGRPRTKFAKGGLIKRFNSKKMYPVMG